MTDTTPPIRNFQRLVQYARPGAILTAGFTSDGDNVYPEWSEGTPGSGGIACFNGTTFVMTTVAGAAAAAGETLGGSGGIGFAECDPRYVNASGDVMEGFLFHPLLPTASGHVANKAYVDSIAPGGDLFIEASASMIASDTDAVIFVDSTSGPVDVELPDPHTAGRRVTVKDFGADGSGNTTVNLVTISPGGAAKIEGVASAISLTQDKESATFVGNGTNWGRI